MRTRCLSVEDYRGVKTTQLLHTRRPNTRRQYQYCRYLHQYFGKHHQCNTSEHLRHGDLQTGAESRQQGFDGQPRSPIPLRNYRLSFSFQDFRPLHGILSLHGRKQATTWTCLVCGTSLTLIQKVCFLSCSVHTTSISFFSCKTTRYMEGTRGVGSDATQ